MSRNILVAVEDYPDLNGKVKLMYIHTRNISYLSHGISVTVLNFRAKYDYEIDGVKVITLASYENHKKEYDVLVCHAANIKKHYRFLKKYGDSFPLFVFFYHGHEVLKINKTYSKPYSYIHKSKARALVQDLYDVYKLFVWRNYLPRVAKKSHFVFVSLWMLDEFLKWTRIPYDLINDRTSIIYNCIGKAFEEADYDYNSVKEYDFVTIRNSLDSSKYSIDIVNELANNNPELKFLIVGKGEFFTHYKKADNVVWKNQTMNHRAIIDVLQKSRCALMPTRTDAQGLMMCELASTGMPLITSNIPVCHEVFDEFSNVALIENNKTQLQLENVIRKLEQGLPYEKNKKYFNDKTSAIEICLFESILKK